MVQRVQSTARIIVGKMFVNCCVCSCSSSFLIFCTLIGRRHNAHIPDHYKTDDQLFVCVPRSGLF